MPLHHVKSNYNLMLYYTSTYVERVGVSQHDNACSFINARLPVYIILFPKTEWSYTSIKELNKNRCKSFLKIFLTADEVFSV